jgi:S-(hydroxymethyl)glutathione dehydrogenase/alcohol dehydrogenase
VTSAVAHAAVLEAFGEPLVLREVELDAPRPHEVVVRTAACGICHSDRSAQGGDSPRAARVPTVLGHEASGIVESVGSAVSDLRPGDPVVTCAAASCGVCSWCRRGLDQHCDSPLRARPAVERPRLTRDGEAVDTFVGVGGFATRMLLHERALVQIPAHMPLDRAAVLGCAVHTGFGAVRHTAGVRLGETVAVIGCGGVGLNIVQGARMAGASQVIAIDVHPASLDRARAFGATDAVDAADGDPVAAVRELTGGGVDHCFEAVGRPATIVQGCAMTRKRGTITVVGLPRPGDRVEVPVEALFHEKRLQGSKMGRNFLVDIPWYCEMYLAGRLKLDELVSSTISLDEVNRGLDVLETADGARTVIAFEAA